MKKDLHKILDTLTPEELDTLPEEVFQTKELDDVTMKRIQATLAVQTGLSLGTNETTAKDNPYNENTPTAPSHKKKTHTSNTFRRILAAAACTALLLGIGAGAYAYAAARNDYKNALTFFYENELSTEGLTKNEIKEVYRDFYSQSFTNDLTTDVLLNSRPDVVRGYEITGDASEWDTTVPDISLSDYKTPVYYEYEQLYTDIEGTYNPQTHAYRQQFNESIFRKYRNGEKVWEISFQDIKIYGYHGDPVDDSKPVLVYGTNVSPADSKDETVSLIALDKDGTILWETVQNNTPGSDQIDAVLSNPDGSYTAFGRCATDNKQSGNCLCVNKYSENGSPLSANTIDISNHIIENVALTESGYLMHLSSYVIADFARVLKLDFEGNVVGDFSYESEDYDFYIADFCELNDTVYISGYTAPKIEKNVVAYNMRDVLFLRSELAGNNTRSHEELLDMFRDNFTAVLLACEPDSGSPKEFYSVSGSLGDGVYVTGDSVCWFTKDIIDCSYSPQEITMFGNVGHVTSQTKLAILCRFYANLFNADGTFKEQKKLDLMTERHWGK